MLAANPASADLMIRGESNGMPGMVAGEAADNLRMTVQGERMRIINPAHDHVVMVRLDDSRIQEFDAGRKLYESRSLEEKLKLASLAAKRKQARARRIKEVNDLSGSERDKAIAELRRDGIEMDGTLVARTVKSAETRTFTVWVDGVPHELECYKLEIFENQATKPVFSLWLTPDLKARENLLSFYQLGLFSKPVVAELEKVKDFPIRIEALIDNGNLRKRIFCRIQQVERTRVPDFYFAVPEGFKRVPDLLEHLKELRKKREAKATVSCATCGKEVVKRKAKSFNAGGKRGRLFFCDQKCFMSWFKNNKFKEKSNK